MHGFSASPSDYGTPKRFADTCPGRLRDAFKEMAQTQTGPQGELKQAWLTYVEQALHDARFREHQETFGMYKDVGGRP